MVVKPGASKALLKGSLLGRSFHAFHPRERRYQLFRLFHQLSQRSCSLGTHRSKNPLNSARVPNESRTAPSNLTAFQLQGCGVVSELSSLRLLVQPQGASSETFHMLAGEYPLMFIGNKDPCFW